ncbi:hypothetical protein RsTz2092_08590 [Deferribacterales bacterium RsTz2092]|nr:hypothetical protein AGMMS49941_03150 [Deferribacterales bacterium]
MKEFCHRYFKLITFAFVVICASLLLATNIVRGQCTFRGVELSQLADKMELKRIEFEGIEARRTKILNKEALLSLAEQKGFVLMNERNTFVK